MRDPTRQLAALLGGLFLVTSALQIGRVLGMPRDRWWTGVDVPLGLEAASARAEVRLRGERLEIAVGQGRLLLADAGGPRALAPDEVKVRFDEYDRVRSAQLPAVAGFGFGAGGGAVALVLALAGALRGRSSSRRS
jgi:hypothetical protein